MIKKLFSLFILFSLASCSHSSSEDSLVAIQIQDRNGLTETINAPERLENYKHTDFLSSHPYQKVLRLYRNEGKNSGRITTYHPNGSPWQYLEIEEMRAHGVYREWHPNGQLKIDAFVVGGTADVSQGAQKDWLFEGTSRVWNETGCLIAKIPYKNGGIEGKSLYYYPSGQVEKEVSYSKNLLHGDLLIYFPDGTLKEKTGYCKGSKHLLSLGYFPSEEPSWIEEYSDGLLLRGVYYSPQGNLLSEVENGRGFKVLFEGETPVQFVEMKRGEIDGIVKTYNARQELLGTYMMKNRMKHGEEVLYFLPQEKEREGTFPKLSVQWHQDALHGTVKSWYANGHLQSQREYCHNHLSGTSSAWYRDGSLMLVEEYEGGKLLKGLYYKSHQTEPISVVLNGNGVATLFDEKGIFLRKVAYEKGKPADTKE